MTTLEDEAIDHRLTLVFRRIFQDDSLSIDDRTTSSDIEDWDSLNNIKLVIAVEKEFGIKFSLPEIVPLQNVADLKALMRRKGV